MKDLNREVCPRCGNQKLKSWTELTDDEKILVEKLPLSADFTKEERRRNRWCARCWHEFEAGGEVTA
jgi:ribosomal protein S27AE